MKSVQHSLRSDSDNFWRRIHFQLIKLESCHLIVCILVVYVFNSQRISVRISVILDRCIVCTKWYTHNHTIFMAIVMTNVLQPPNLNFASWETCFDSNWGLITTTSKSQFVYPHLLVSRIQMRHWVFNRCLSRRGF